MYWDKVQEPAGPSMGIRMQQVSEASKTPVQQPKMCPPGRHDFELVSNETWSYDGTHLLANGDHLTIFERNESTVVVWAGAVHLRSYEVYTEKALGCWIHADQRGVEREIWARWFFDKYPARLVPAREASCP